MKFAKFYGRHLLHFTFHNHANFAVLIIRKMLPLVVVLDFVFVQNSVNSTDDMINRYLLIDI